MFKNNKGYAPYRRQISDELSGSKNMKEFMAFNSLKAMKGSDKYIIDPYEMLKNNYAKAVIVATRQMINNQIAKAAPYLKEFIKEIPVGFATK